MKSLYPISQFDLFSATAVLRKSVKHIFVLWFLSFAISSAYAQGLVFQNSRLESGVAGADKAVYRFPNVKTGLDALVTIKGRSDKKVVLEDIDVTTSGHSKSFQPQVTYNNSSTSGGQDVAPGRANWYMDFEVTIVKAGTKIRQQVSEIDVTALDIDGNSNKLREYVVFTDPISVTTELISSLKINEQPIIDFDAENGDPVMCGSCKVGTPLILCGGCNGSGLISTIINGLLGNKTCNTCNGSGKLHSGCNHAYKASNSGKGSGKSFTYAGPTTTFDKIDTFATQVMVTGTWVNTDEVTFRVGAENLSNTSQEAANRMYSLWFKEFRYLAASMLPVKLGEWKASLAKTGVDLNWTAEVERNTSRFVVERSLDGKTFQAIGEVAAAGYSDAKRDYKYNDNKIGNTTGVIYYRLATMDLDGKADYSSVKTVRVTGAVASGATLAISTYPNPTVNAVNVTVPANWQGKKVTFEIYSVNGTLVKAVVNEHAGQVEQMQVNTLSRGLYIVKATAGAESASQRIVKSN